MRYLLFLEAAQKESVIKRKRRSKLIGLLTWTATMSAHAQITIEINPAFN